MGPYWIAQVDASAAFSLLGFVLITIPLFWLLRAWNVGCALYIFWTGGRCLTSAINILLWRENIINFAPPETRILFAVDIRFYMASGIGVVSSGLAISHRLYHIANITTINPTTAQRRRNLITDLLIALGIPVLAAALYWVYQGHRFNIYEGLGCIPAYPTTFLSIFLYAAWPLVIGLISAPYAVLALRAVRRHTKELKQLQVLEPDGLIMSSYYRLIMLATADIFFTVPLSIYVLVTGICNNAFYPYHGLADLHLGFGRVLNIPAVVWRQHTLNESVTNFTIWMPIASAMWFFAVFGFTSEARTHYRLALIWVAKRVGVSESVFQRQQGATSEATTISFQRRVVDSGLSDTIQDDRSTTRPAPAVIDVCQSSRRPRHFADWGDSLPAESESATAAQSACRIETSLKKDNIADMSWIMEPVPAYVRSLSGLSSVPPPPLSLPIRQNIDSLSQMPLYSLDIT